MRLRLLGFLVLVLSVATASADSYVVTSTADSGPGTLRQGILDANSGACATCLITFLGELPPRPERLTLRIELLSELPAITASNVHIYAAAASFDVRSEVVVDGSRAGAGAVGLRVNGARNFETIALTFQNFGGGGMVLEGVNDAILQSTSFNDNGADGLVIRDSNRIRVAQPRILRNAGNGVVAQRVTGLALDNGSIGAFVRTSDRVIEAHPNGGHGVHLDSVLRSDVGGSVIQHNGGHGILVTGDSVENSLGFNEYGHNALLAVDLGGDGPTPNDPGDADTGPNHLQNSPVLEAAILNRGILRVRGHLDGQPETQYALLFSIAEPDPSGFGEGGKWLLSHQIPMVTTDASGRANFTVDFGQIFAIDFGAGTSITAAASRVISNAIWETSEFSRNVQAVEGAVRFTVTNTSDSGPGSLRAVIDEANSADCAATFVCEIAFNVLTPPNEQGVWTIQPRSPLPAITRSGIWLDGATQTQIAGNTNPHGPEIEINGAACGACNGLELRATAERNVELSTVRDVIVNGFSGHGILVQGQAGGRTVETRIDGSFIGTDTTGRRPVPNGGSGIYVADAFASVGEVGDSRIRARGPRGNLISGNLSDGITTVSSTPNRAGVYAWANIISSDVTRLYPLPNGGNGITSGAADRMERNVIGFSKGAGVLVTGPPASTSIVSNIIHSNGGPGIDVRREPEFVAPVIESAHYSGGRTRVRFSLPAPPREFPSWYWIDLFSASFTDASGNGEGRWVVANQLINNKEQTVYEFEVDQDLTGKFVSMTATPFDTFYYAPSGPTSEFSRAFQVTAEGCQVAHVTLEAPANGTETTGPITFRWTPVPGAIVYRLWTMKPGSPVTLAYEGPLPTATLAFAPAGVYEWWVEARFTCYGSQTEHRTVVFR